MGGGHSKNSSGKQTHGRGAGRWARVGDNNCIPISETNTPTAPGVLATLVSTADSAASVRNGI